MWQVIQFYDGKSVGPHYFELDSIVSSKFYFLPVFGVQIIRKMTSESQCTNENLAF